MKRILVTSIIAIFVACGAASAGVHLGLPNAVKAKVAELEEKIGTKTYLPPAAPTTLSVRVSTPTHSVDLLWEDASETEDGFIVQRATEIAGVPGRWEAKASVAANTVSYEDSSVALSTTYWYRVCSFNSAGISPSSNQAQAYYHETTGWRDIHGNRPGDPNVYPGIGSVHSVRPSLCIDSGGNPHIAWAENGIINYLKWNGSAWVDTGGTNQENIAISTVTTATEQNAPSLALDSLDRPHIAWVGKIDGLSKICYLAWDGANWATKGELAITTQPVNAQNLRLALDDQEPHIVWEEQSQSNNEIFYLYWKDSESSWVDADGSSQESINISASSTHSSNPALAMDDAGNPHAVWLEKNGSEYKAVYRFWDGGWKNADRSTSAENSVFAVFSSTPTTCQLALDAFGNPHIVWYNAVGLSNFDIFYLSWNGSAWVDADGTGQESVDISQTAGASFFPSLALDAGNKPHIAWEDNSSGNYEIYYLYWDGSGWVDTDGVGRGNINISRTSGNSARPSLALDGTGAPRIAWEDATTGGGDVYYLQWK